MEPIPTTITPTTTDISYTLSATSNIIVVSPIVLLPVIVDRRDRSKGRVGARIVVEDLHLMLKTLNTWQQSSEHIAALVCGCDTYYTTAVAKGSSVTSTATTRCFAVGVLSPLVTESEDEDEVITEGRVSVVLVPPVHVHLPYLYSSFSISSHTFPTPEMIAAVGYCGKLITRPPPLIGGFYEASIVQRFVDPMRYSDYEFKPVTEAIAAPDILAGPMVGYVTSAATILMVFYSKDQYVVLELMDAVTGIVYSNRQRARNNDPVFFTFSELVDKRLYHIVYKDKTVGSFIANVTVSSVLVEPDITIPSSWRCVSPEHRLATSIVEQTLFDSSRTMAMKQFESTDVPAVTKKKTELQHQKSALRKFSRAISNVHETTSTSNQVTEIMMYVVGDVSMSATLCASLAAVAEISSNLFVHMGSPVNLSSSLPLLVNHIRANDMDAASKHLDIYYTGAYSSCSSRLRAHGSHIYSDCAEFEVMRACGYSSILNLVNDLGQVSLIYFTNV